MAKQLEYADVNLDIRSAPERAVKIRDSDAAFRILVLGDFSGRQTSGSEATPVSPRLTREGSGMRDAGKVDAAKLACRKPVEVDRDSFDDVFARLHPAINVPLGERLAVLQFGELNDFRPDRIFEHAELFRNLREARQKLSDPAAFSNRATGTSQEGMNRRMPPDPVAAGLESVTGASLLDAAISNSEMRSDSTDQRRQPTELSAFIERAVAPHRVTAADPRQAELERLVDQAAAAQMRALLQFADFKALEARWRELFWLVRRIETSSTLKIYLLDASQAAIAEEISSAANPEDTWLYDVLVRQTVETAGGEPWAVIAGLFTFDLGDAKLLRHLGRLASAAGAPFIAGASPRLLGCEQSSDLAEPRKWRAPNPSGEAREWAALRASPEAAYLGLAMPRFLLRLPYGRETDPVDGFDFEEAAGELAHEDYEWGNPAVLCVSVLGQSFEDGGWAMQPARFTEISGLPLHIYKEAGETCAKPCAEVLLTQDAAERMLDAGVMPVVSLKNRDSVRLLRMQSLASPLHPLAGGWNREN